MSQALIENRGEVAILRLNNGVINAISPTLLEDMSSALNQIKNEYNGMVLAGGQKFFSIGLELPTLLKLNRADMTHFFDRFLQVVFELYTFPLPSVCALAGHAPAGGTVFALTCDYRFAATGREVIGLNEVKIGLPVPVIADGMLRQIVGDRAATEILYSGEFLQPEAAQQIGLVDEIFPVDEVEDRAVEKINRLLTPPRYSLPIMKANRVEAVKSKFLAHKTADVEAFIECWFKSPTQNLLNETALQF